MTLLTAKSAATPATPLVAHCPALFLAAPASGQGKTTITAALARYHKELGRNVRGSFDCRV